MRTTASLLCMLSLLSACKKSDNTLPDPVVPQKPTSVTIKYYNSSGLRQTSAYTALSSDQGQFSILLSDTSYFSSNQFNVYQTKISLFSNSINRITRALLENKKSEQVLLYTNSPAIKVPISQSYGNLKLTATPLSATVPNQVYYDKVQITQFSDSAQQHTETSGQFFLESGLAGGFPYYRLSTNGGNRNDAFQEKADSLLLNDNNTQASDFTPLRYQNYFLSEVSWYRTGDVNQAMYSKKSALACDKFTLHNGYYNLVPNGPFSFTSVFVPQFERKIDYSYSQDTAKLKELMAFVNPGLLDPVWYYIDYYRRSAPMPSYSEGNDFYNTYDWTSVASTDSVFTVNGSSRQFKQAASAKNTIEKDDKGRIVKITRRISNKDVYKVMEIVY